MKRIIFIFLKFIVKLLFSCLVGGFLVILAAFIFYLDNQDDLKIWHQVKLDEEFTVNSSIHTFKEYLILEDRLFSQLNDLVYAKLDESDQSPINRYFSGSKSDPQQWEQNWNRSFVMTAKKPRAGILLLHGMSDSPYLMRNLAEQLHAGGATVIVLRLPGHGTAPSGLVNVQWEDMAKAVRLATVHLKNSIGDKKLYLVGFSTGGALSVNYALSSLQDPGLPVVSGIALLSPAIGLGPEAALAIWQDRLGRLLGLDKLAWNAVLPEYDPFKYNSFAINAGDLVYRLTVEIQKQIDGLSQVQLDRFPKLLAFQSLVDATVSTPELVEGLFKRLPEGEHELVLFNINRKLEVEHLLKSDPGKGLRNLLENESLPFAISVISNKNEETFEVVIRQKAANSRIITEQETEMSWPKGIFSLSHVALPISESDSLYGGIKKSDNKNLHLGNLALRGEIGILKLTGNDMLRMRWNPFLPYIKQRITNFFNLSSPKQVTIGGKEEIDQSESNVKPLI